MSSSDLRSLFTSGGRDLNAQEVFTNRHDEWRAVVKSLLAHAATTAAPGFSVTDFASPRRNVLVFYGVGGIGKTTFAKKLEAHMTAKSVEHPAAGWSAIPDEVGPLLPVRIDLSRQSGVDLEDAVLAVRLAVGRLGRPMRAFDLAMRHYWEVNHPGEPLDGYLQRNSFLRRLSRSVSLPKDISVAVEDIAGALQIPTAVGATAAAVTRALVKALREHRDAVRALAGCDRLADLLEADQDITTLSYMPYLLAWDLAQLPAKQTGTPVILFDTFEEIAGRSYRDVEQLFQRMVWLMPNALFIITGRNRLQWDTELLEGQLDWTGPARWPGLTATAVGEPRQHLVGFLSEDDCDQYLRTRLTRADKPVISASARAEIVARSHGLPLYLDLAVMRFIELLDRTGTPPGPEEFQRDFPALVARVVRDLTADERTVLRTVSLLDSFTVDLATTASGLRHDAPVRNLIERPIVIDDPFAPWPFRLHDVIRSAVREADATAEDRWSHDDWRRAAQSTFDALGTQIPARGGYRWRRGLMSCLTEGLRLACEFGLDPGWLTAAAWRYVIESVWEPLEIPDRSESLSPAMALARTLHAVSQGQRAHRRDSADELGTVLSWNLLPEPAQDLARYFLAESQRHLGLYDASADNMRRVAAGNSPMAGEALRGVSHIARHVGRFDDALAAIDALDRDTHYHRALGHLWWTQGDIAVACDAYATARRAALAADNPGHAVLAQAGLAFAAALDDGGRARQQIALANKLLHGVKQNWSETQIATATLLLDAGFDPDLPARFDELEARADASGLGSAVAYIRFSRCFHHAIRGETDQLIAAREQLTLSTTGGEYAYLVEITHFFDDTQPPPELPTAQWIDGRDTAAGRWRRLITTRRRAITEDSTMKPPASITLPTVTRETVAPLNPESARHALHLAALEADIDTGDAELIRIGENAIYRLRSQGVAARVARTAQQQAVVDKELAVARWLAHHDYPAVRIAERLPQPIQADGRLVTFWELVDIHGEATNSHLAALLRDFHRLPAPDHPLPRFDPFAKIPTRLANPGNADPADVAYLTDLYNDLKTRYGALGFGDASTVIHGDAHLGNIIPTTTGPLLSDFEVVARGPWQWDLTTTAMTVDRFDMPRGEYAEFCRIYGCDVTELPEYPILRAVRELTMITWLMQLVDVSPDHAREFTHRVNSLRDGEPARRWHIF